MARVPTAFLVLPNFHSCFYNSIETRYMFSISLTLKANYLSNTYVEGEGDAGMFIVVGCGTLIALKTNGNNRLLIRIALRHGQKMKIALRTKETHALYLRRGAGIATNRRMVRVRL